MVIFITLQNCDKTRVRQQSLNKVCNEYHLQWLTCSCFILFFTAKAIKYGICDSDRDSDRDRDRDRDRDSDGDRDHAFA